MEEWKEIEECPDYFISNYGRLKNKDGLVETRTNYQGFNIFIFYEFEENEFCVNIDFLVFRHHNNLNFNKKDSIIIHLNNNRYDDNINNLQSIKFEDYLTRIRSKNVMMERKAIEIRKLCAEGKLTQKAIGEMFEVSSSTVSQIKNNRIWKHIK